MIKRIEIEFALPVEISDVQHVALDRVIDDICKKNCPEGWAFWPAGIGSKPTWSRMDALFLGKEPDPDAPDTGEPTFDDSILHVECAARELYPEEIERNRKRAEERVDRERSLLYRIRLWWYRNRWTRT